jgi:hypothetical protein
MNMTPKRRAFILAAIADDGRVFSSSVNNGVVFYRAGSGENAVKLTEMNGETLLRAGMIEAVKKPNSQSTEGWDNGFLYRVTEAAIAAVAVK